MKIKFNSKVAGLQHITSTHTKNISLNLENNYQSVSIIPQNSLVITLPGIFTSSSLVTPLGRHLSKEGHIVYVEQVPQVLLGQRLERGKLWILNTVDNIRINETKENLNFLQKQQGNLKDFFLLDESETGKTINNYLTNLLSPGSSFLKKISLLKPFYDYYPKPDCERLSNVIYDYQNKLINTLNIEGKKKLKIANYIFDKIAPRAVLVAHSLGGAVCLQSLQHTEQNGIAMILGIAAPFNGAPFPSKANFLKPLISSLVIATHQIRPESNLVKKMRNSPLPYDTTVIGFACNNDSLVSIENNQLKNNLPGTLQMVLPEKKADMVTLVEDNNYNPLHNWIKLKHASLYNRLSERGFVEFTGIQYHCGFLDPQYFQFYWSDTGVIEQELFDNSNSMKNLKRLLHPQNYEGMQKQILCRLLQNINKNTDKVKKYIELVPELQALVKNDLPFKNSSSKLAKEILSSLQ